MFSIITYMLDDDKEELELVQPHLEAVCAPVGLKLFTDVEKFIDEIDAYGPHIAIIDHRLSAAVDGIEVGKRVLRKNRFVFLVLYSGSASADVWETAMNAGFKRGVNKNKPGAIEKLASIVAAELVDVRQRMDAWESLRQLKAKYEDAL